MKRYSKQQLAKGYLVLAERSPRRAAQALAAALISQRATRDVDLVVREIARRLLAQGEAHVRVSSARPLSAKHQRSLAQLIRHLTGAATVQAEYAVDPALHAGFVVETPTAVLDGSVAGLLKSLYA